MLKSMNSEIAIPLRYKIGSNRFWFDFADTSAQNMTQSGGLVSSVWNKAGSLVATASQGTTGKQPTIGAINGRSALDFNGTSTLLNADALAAIFSGSDKPFTIFSVSECDAPSSGLQSSIWAFGYSGSTSQFQSQVYQNSLNISNRRDDAGTIAGSFAPAIAGVNVSCIIFTGTTISSYTNTTVNYANTAMDVGVLTLDKFTIGATSRTAEQHFFDGRIGEIIGYEGAMNNTERLAIMNFLGTKWGVAVS